MFPALVLGLLSFQTDACTTFVAGSHVFIGFLCPCLFVSIVCYLLLCFRTRCDGRWVRGKPEFVFFSFSFCATFCLLAFSFYRQKVLPLVCFFSFPLIVMMAKLIPVWYPHFMSLCFCLPCLSFRSKRDFCDLDYCGDRYWSPA